MLETILSISGKPGLYKIVSQGKNMIIVESLLNGKRGPAYAHEKIISLSDIAIFTEDGDKPLVEVLESIKTRENGQKASIRNRMQRRSENTWQKYCRILIESGFTPRILRRC